MRHRVLTQNVWSGSYRGRYLLYQPHRRNALVELLKSHCSVPCILALQECWTSELAEAIAMAFPSHNIFYRSVGHMTVSAYALLFGVYGLVLALTLPLTLVFLSTWVAFIISGSILMVFHAWARTTASFAFITGDVAGGLITLYPRLDSDTKVTTCTAIKLPSPQHQYFWLEKLKDRYALYVQPPSNSLLPSTLNLHMCLTPVDLDPSAQWLAQMAFVRRIIAGQITNVDSPDVLLGDFNHDRITLSFDYNDDHPVAQTTFDKSNPLTKSSSYPGADPVDGSPALRLDHIFVHKRCQFSPSVLVSSDEQPVSDHYGLVRQSSETN